LQGRKRDYFSEHSRPSPHENNEMKKK
jgi:hypothetical protein